MEAKDIEEKCYYLKDKVTKEFSPIKFEVREFLPGRKPPMDGTDTPGCFMNLSIGERGYYGGSWLNVNWANGHYIDIGPFKCQVKNIIEKNYDKATDTSTVTFNIPRFFYCGYYVKGKLVSSYYLEGTITIKVPSNILIPPSEDEE